MTNVRLYYRFCRFCCRCACLLLWKVRYHGMHHVPRTGGVVLVCNHQSFMDPVIATMPLPREGHYMARDSLFRNRFFGWLIGSLNAFPVKRGSADIGAIKESLRRLKQGRLVVLFPEGTRSPDGRIKPMLPGLVAIARKSCTPIIPTLIDGAFQAWPKRSPLPLTGDVIVEYDRPIPPDEYKDLSAEKLMDLIRIRLIDMQHRWHTRFPPRRLDWYQAPSQ